MRPRAREPIILLLCLLLLGSCTFLRMVRYGNSDIDDHCCIFPTRELTASAHPRPFPRASAALTAGGSQAALPEGGAGNVRGTLPTHVARELDAFLAAHDTGAFLVVHRGAIVYERYFGDHRRDSATLAFSMSKSVLSLLVGCAVDDGIIASVQQPVTDYVPELADRGFGEVTIEHLLQMTSGMDFRESPSPLRQHPYFYYGDDLERRLLRQKLAVPPGTEFAYKSGENQLLGLVLARALGEETITSYTQRRVWEPVGMEFGGCWAVDHEPGGLEKTFCCLAIAARDVAKIGRLYLDEGRAAVEQVVSPEWVRRSLAVDTSAGSVVFYQYQWWLPFADSPVFMASGHRGEFLYVNPELDLIMVRLGPSTGHLSHAEWRAYLYGLEEAFGLRLPGPPPVDLVAAWFGHRR